MDLLRIAARVAVRTAGEAWDLGMFDGLEQQAYDAAQKVGTQAVRETVVSAYDKAFGTSFSSGEVPFHSPIEYLNLDDLFHELLHHSFNPKKYTDYSSQLEGAVHEHAMRVYQDTPGSFDQMHETLSQMAEAVGMEGGLGDRDEPETPEQVDALVGAIEEDVGRAEDPKVKTVLLQALRQLKAMVKRGLSMEDSVGKFEDVLLDLASSRSDTVVPDGAEEGVRRWYRQLTLDLRRLQAPITA